MTKTLASVILAMFAAVAFNAQAASHAAGAPMKASEAAKKDDKKPAAKKDEKKAEKKEEAKK